MIYAMKVYWSIYDDTNYQVFKTIYMEVIMDMVKNCHRWGFGFETFVTYDDTL